MKRRKIELTPLLWMDPPGEVIRRLYLDARRAVMRYHMTFGTSGYTDAEIDSRQRYMREVQEEFVRRMVAAGIAVEGVNW